MNALDTLLEPIFPVDAPGAAIGVVIDGEVRYVKGFGLANLNTRVPFTADTQFRACSVSKQFVCLLVRQLEREGLLALDAHPSKYVPALAMFPESLTVRHLCQNRSGLHDYWCVAMLTGAKLDSPFTLKEGAELIRRLHKPMFPPGAQYSYNNGNWRILEWIIGAVTSRPLSDLLAERIFGPLGMVHSGWGSDTSLALPGNPRGYRRLEDGWEEEVTRACWSGDAALTTTMNDYLRWELAMLKADTMLLPCADMLAQAMPHPDGERGSYAFGINAWQQGERWMHWHSGALRGWRMVQMRFPQDRIAIVVMLNRTENPMPIAMKIAACVGVKTTWDEVEALPSAPNPEIAGVYYSSELDLLVEARQEADEVSISLGGDYMPLLRTGDHTWANASNFCSVGFDGGQLDIHERQFGWHSKFVRLPDGDERAAIGGMEFHSDLLHSTIAFADDGATLRLRGPAGQSDIYPVRPLGRNMLAFDCLRALDETPPGRFTIHISEDRRKIVVGCFMARGLEFVR